MLKMGDALRAQREHKGFSQADLAKRLALTRQAVSNWERDLSYPDADTLVRLAEVLDCDVRLLLGIKQQRDWQGWLRLQLQDIQEVMQMPKSPKPSSVIPAAKQYIPGLFIEFQKSSAIP